MLKAEELELLSQSESVVGSRLTISQRAQIYRLRAKNLVRAFVEEIVSQNPSYTYIEDYECLPSKKVDTHGTIDFLLFNKEDQQNHNFPMLAVYVPQVIFDSVNDVLRFEMDTSPAASISQWLVTTKLSYFQTDPAFKARAKDNLSIDRSHVLMTTGHTWQLFEIASDFEVRRTHIYKPSTLAKLTSEKKLMFGNPVGEALDRKIWNDFEMIQLALGMLKLGMGCASEGEQ